MSDNTRDRSNSSGRKTLSLQRSSTGTVRQSMSGGRTNTVVVEKRRRRMVTPGEAGKGPETVEEAKVVAPAAPAPVAQPQRPAPSQPASSDRLTNDERDARAQALADARVREAREAEERRIAQERAEAEARLLEEEERRKAELEAKKEAERRAKEEARLAEDEEDDDAAPAPAPVFSEAEDEEGRSKKNLSLADIARVKKPKVAEVPAKKAVKKGEDDRRRGKLTITNAFEDGERQRSLASFRRRAEKQKAKQLANEPREKISREVIIPETITVQELANRMAERAVDVIKLLMQQGQMLKAADVIDSDLAQLIAEDMGHTVKRVAEADVEIGLFAEEDSPEKLRKRPPVVTIMGHVDHGKTSLLDALRQANVVAGEAGGITQHIGAYQVEQNGEKITFIDTPGHAAFTAMRARGAKATDIVILVVAADDGVMPQTIEAINHAKAAGVPIIVAINKIDKPSAEPTRVRTELLQPEVFVESMGGDVQEAEISALKRINRDGLLEQVLLQAEVLELKANVERPADGVVIEAKLDKGRGPVATVLVQRGTLKQGDIVVAGSKYARVRALINDKGEQVAEAGPAMPVEVLGFNGAPLAGDTFAVVDNESRAREIADYRERKEREKQVARQTGARGSLEQMMSDLQTSDLKEFPLLIKADVQGSTEAIIGALDKISTKEVRARVIHSGVGGITESDVALAEASNAAIIAFNVRPNKQARDAAEQAGIEIRYYNVIYNLVDDV